MPNARTRRKRSITPAIDISTWEGELPLPEKPPMFEGGFTMDIEPDDTVAVVLTRDMIVNVIGKNTGRLYVFSGAGSVIDDVDRLDAEAMLQKGINNSCCGTQSTPYFLILGR